jgi:hypothetical protein
LIEKLRSPVTADVSAGRPAHDVKVSPVLPPVPEPAKPLTARDAASEWQLAGASFDAGGIGPPANRWLGGSLRGGVGTDTGMHSDTIMALSELMGLAAAALTGALRGSPMVTATFRWFAS